MRKQNLRTFTLPMFLLAIGLFIFQSCQKEAIDQIGEESQQALILNDLSKNTTALFSVIEKLDNDYGYPANVPSEAEVNSNKELLKLMEEYENSTIKIASYELTENEMYDAMKTLVDEDRIQVSIPQALTNGHTYSATERDPCRGNSLGLSFAITACSSGGIVFSYFFSDEVTACIEAAYEVYNNGCN